LSIALLDVNVLVVLFDPAHDNHDQRTPQSKRLPPKWPAVCEAFAPQLTIISGRILRPLWMNRYFDYL
jgi:hypothetical protein